VGREGTEAGRPQKRPSYLALLRDRSFGSLWLAQVVSQSGDAVFDVALLWLVFASTGSTALVGITQAAALLPSVVAGPIAGVYADRFNRRNLMIVSNLAQGVITAAISALYLAGMLHFELLILLVLLLFSGAQFVRAANNAMVPRIVKREDLAAANGLFTLSSSANQLASYSIGGIAMAVLGAAASVTYDSLTFLFAAAMLTLIAKSYGQARVDTPSSTRPIGTRGNFWTEFREGLRYIRTSRLFLELIVFGLVVNFFAAFLSPLLAPYTAAWIHGDASMYGFLLSSFALGMIIGSVAIGKVNYRAYVGRLLFAGVVVAGVLFMAVGFVTTAPVALILFFLLGVVIAIVNQPIQVLVQTQVPGELLGRAVTVMGAVLGGAQPVAAILAGTLASISSVGLVFIGAGIAMAVVTAALYLPFSELARAKY
jgi:MFS family permease